MKIVAKINVLMLIILLCLNSGLLADIIKKQENNILISPEGSSGFTNKKLVESMNYMVSSATVESTEIAIDILKKGGNAVDAAIATQLVLGLVEPQSSGLGGGAFFVYYDAQSKKTITIDARETAPKNVKENMFLDDKGNPLSFMEAVVGGKSVATPGALKLLWYIHTKYGKLSWKDIVEPTINLAEKGFVVSPRLAQLIKEFEIHLKKDKQTKDYFFYNNGQPLQAGDIKINKDYANLLKLTIINNNVDDFYKGKIAQDIVKVVNNSTNNKGFISKQDLSNYDISVKDPLCFSYRVYTICGINPPSAGTIALGQILGILENYPMAKLNNTPEAWRLFGESMRIAIADTMLYVADEQFVKVPVAEMLDKKYLKQRADLIKKGVQDIINPLIINNDEISFNYAPDNSLELPSTTHFSIIDNEGNIVSMTSTIENAFGSMLMTNGFLLNNEMTDFSFLPKKEGKEVANKIVPGKKPKSSMTPVIVFDKDMKPVLVVGSPGGVRIIGYVAKMLVAVLDWKMDVQQANDLPNMINLLGNYEVEKFLVDKKLVKQLEAMKYNIIQKELTSGVHAIEIKYKNNKKDLLQGSADIRRSGIALGN